MAKTNGVNKSQAVRDFLKANKKAKNSEVVAALAKQGISITANYVGNIKATNNKRRRAVRQVVAKGGIGIPEVKAALAFLKVAGSVKAATQALAMVRRLGRLCKGGLMTAWTPNQNPLCPSRLHPPDVRIDGYPPLPYGQVDHRHHLSFHRRAARPRSALRSVALNGQVSEISPGVDGAIEETDTKHRFIEYEPTAVFHRDDPRRLCRLVDWRLLCPRTDDDIPGQYAWECNRSVRCLADHERLFGVRVSAVCSYGSRMEFQVLPSHPAAGFPGSLFCSLEVLAAHAGTKTRFQFARQRLGRK